MHVVLPFHYDATTQIKNKINKYDITTYNIAL